MNNCYIMCVVYVVTKSRDLVCICKDIYKQTLFGIIEDQMYNKRKTTLRKSPILLESWIVPEVINNIRIILLNHSSYEYWLCNIKDVKKIIIEMIIEGRVKMEDKLEIRSINQGILSKELLYNYVY